MSTKEIIFYMHSSDHFPVSFKLIEKLYESGENILYLCKTVEEVKIFDAKLWSFSKTSFIPHGCVCDESVAFYQTFFSTKLTFINNPTSLMHNGLDIKQHENIQKFEKIIDIFSHDSLDAARERADFYKHSGFTQQKGWQQLKPGSWTKLLF